MKNWLSVIFLTEKWNRRRYWNRYARKGNFLDCFCFCLNNFFFPFRIECTLKKKFLFRYRAAAGFDVSENMTKKVKKKIILYMSPKCKAFLLILHTSIPRAHTFNVCWEPHTQHTLEIYSIAIERRRKKLLLLFLFWCWPMVVVPLLCVNAQPTQNEMKNRKVFYLYKK